MTEKLNRRGFMAVGSIGLAGTAMNIGLDVGRFGRNHGAGYAGRNRSRCGGGSHGAQDAPGHAWRQRLQGDRQFCQHALVAQSRT